MNKDQNVLDKEIIKQYALNYLAKFGTTEKCLEKFLLNKIKKNYKIENTEKLNKQIRLVIDCCKQMGYINDIQFCESRIKSLLREGNSLFNIKYKLLQKNISLETFEQAINNVINKQSLDNLLQYAAIKYAKKRNFLSYQSKALERDKFKIINKFYQKGFSKEITEKILSFTEEEVITFINTLERDYNL